METSRDILEILIERRRETVKSTLLGLVIKWVDEGNEAVRDGDSLVLSLLDLDDSKSIIRNRKVRRGN